MCESRKNPWPITLLLVGFLIASPLWAETDDPMRPPQGRQTTAPPSEPSWDLSSILISDDRRLAVINDVLRKPGQWVDGARVLRIDADHVVIRHADGEQTLSLRSNLSISRSGQ